jgi:hypothetical protein
MSFEEYQTLSGITVPTSKVTFVTALIPRARAILEGLLGYTLVEANVDNNEYVSIGQTSTDCPCPDVVDVSDLLPPDAVVKAYRLYDYKENDTFISIDPCTAVNAVKLVKDGVTFKTLDPDLYRVQFKQGLAKFIEQIECFCAAITESCWGAQLAVDADWVWEDEEDMPVELRYIWVDMITFYAKGDKTNLKSESLGPHSYTLFEETPPERLEDNAKIIQKYAGPNGSLNKAATL